MQAHLSRPGRPIFFRRDNLLYQITTVVVAWAMIMSSLPAYAASLPRSQWIDSSSPDSRPVPAENLGSHTPIRTGSTGRT